MLNVVFALASIAAGVGAVCAIEFAVEWWDRRTRRAAESASVIDSSQNWRNGTRVLVGRAWSAEDALATNMTIFYRGESGWETVAERELPSRGIVLRD